MGALREKMDDHREAVLYILFGGLTTLVTWGTYALFVHYGMELNISNILSWVCGVLFAFTVNKWFVFTCRSLEPKVVFKELSSFISARIFTGVIAIILFPILLMVGIDGVMFGTEGFVAKIITSLVEIVLNWVFSKYFVFTGKIVDTGSDATEGKEQQ